MGLKGVMGIETEYGMLGGCPYSLVRNCPVKKAPHYNAAFTNDSFVPDVQDLRPLEGDYEWLLGWERVERWPAGQSKQVDTPTPVLRHDDFPDYMIENGARLYVDMGHPEYCTPETSNPLDAVVWDKAGELILNEARKRTDPAILLLKNNSDGKQNSYGCHEGYTTRRYGEYDFRKKLVPGLLPYLVTRQIFAGAGKVGIEKPSERPWLERLAGAFNLSGPRFQLSQRADFIQCVLGLQTTYDRPIINTRDEAHAPSPYARLHLICGDANMSEISAYLKMGATALVLEAIEDGLVKPLELLDPVGSFKEVSRDPSYRWLVRLADRNTVPAVDIQRQYLAAAQKYRERDEITDDVLNRWEYVLDKLEGDPMSLGRWLDWVAKKSLIDSLPHAPKANELRNIDLHYHNIDRQKGLFYILQDKGLVERLVSDEEILRAVSDPPQDTRARLRAAHVKQGGCTADWSEVKTNGKTVKLPSLILETAKEVTR